MSTAAERSGINLASLPSIENTTEKVRSINTETPLHVLSPKTLFIEFQPMSEILAKILMISRLKVAHITRLNAENRTRERKKCLKVALCADSVTAI